MRDVVINSSASLEAYKTRLDLMFEEHKYLRVSNIRTGKNRSLSQNSALHLFCSNLASAMNDAGFEFRSFMNDGYAVPFSKQLVLDHMWRPVQKAVTGHESTRKPEMAEYFLIYDVLNSKLADHGIHVPWPLKDIEC